MGSDEPGRIVPFANDGIEGFELDLTRPDAYGRAFGDVYDRWYGPNTTTEGDLATMAAFVADRTPGGLVIELGVGSGRLAAPLAQAGLWIIGLDASLEMLQQCPTSAVRVAADMADLPFRERQADDTTGPGPTMLCGFNTVFNIGSRERLDRLLRSTAGLGATFISETMNVGLLPEVALTSTDLAPHQVPGGIVVSSTSIDLGRRQLAGRHLEITDQGVTNRPWLLHPVGHDELDRRAADCGLILAERHRSWAAEVFTESDPSVISVYRPRS